jgi:hypothetical protein
VVVDEFKNGLALSYRANAAYNSDQEAGIPDAVTGNVANFAPLVFKAYNSWNAGIRVLNVDPQNHAQVKVSFRDTAGTIVFTFEDDIDRQSFKDYFFQDFANLPQNFVGSATVESLNYSYPGAEGAFPVVSVAQEVKWTIPGNDEVQYPQGMAYNTINYDEGSNMIAAPFMAKHVGGWSTGLEIMNMNREPGTATVTTNFYTAAGRVWTTDGTLNGFATNGRQFDLRYVAAIPEGFLGSAVSMVSATTQGRGDAALDGYIGGIVNEVAVDGTFSDGGKSYEAYPIYPILQ